MRRLGGGGGHSSNNSYLSQIYIKKQNKSAQCILIVSQNLISCDLFGN